MTEEVLLSVLIIYNHLEMVKPINRLRKNCEDIFILK